MAIYKNYIRQKNNSGQYDYLLPFTTIDLVDGLQLELDRLQEEIDNGVDEGIVQRVSDLEEAISHIPNDGVIDDIRADVSAINGSLSNKANSSTVNTLSNDMFVHSNKLATLTTSGHVYHGEGIINLTSSSWSNSAPFSQTVSIAGLSNMDNPICAVKYSDNNTLTIKKAIKSAWNLVDDIKCDNNTITFYCFEEKPNVDMNVIVKVIR